MKRAARAVKAGTSWMGRGKKGEQARSKDGLLRGPGKPRGSDGQIFNAIWDPNIKQIRRLNQDTTSVPDAQEPREDTTLKGEGSTSTHWRKKVTDDSISRKKIREAKQEIREQTSRSSQHGRSIDSTTTLHLFRSLLREASYLPDPASRKFFQAHYRSRFRDYCPRKPEPGSVFRGNDSHSAKDVESLKKSYKRNVQMLAEARQELRFLQKANAGMDNALTKVLDLTYGRRGRRKHDLLKALMPPNRNPINDQELRTLSEALDSPSKEQASKPNMPLFSDKFVALIKSQMRQKQGAYKKPLPKSSAPKIPETNTWGRPMPVVRIKNLTKKWYAETLDRLMPPLPEAEWIRLGELALGKESWLGPPQRRARGTGSFEKAGRPRGKKWRKQSGRGKWSIKPGKPIP
ncbi:hypothetical protein G7Y79_00014g037770 [Physcia stellaris]|nr:hypothetical protein G7Y79_00014g037770 [Physcia stellaris]